MPNCTYIIYSEVLDKYYVGETEDFGLRLQQHNTGHYGNAYTARANDWKQYVLIACPSKTVAIKLEHFIKRMKSRKFIEQLKDDEDMRQSILVKIIESG